MNSKEIKENRNKKYNEYVKTVTPKSNLFAACFRAFVVGGGICVIGEVIVNTLIDKGVSEKDSGLYMMIILILMSIILTGLNVYPKLAKWAGAGTLVPITGFANSVVSPAIEYKKEGWVFGVGCKIFTIAGPVILYGILSSWIIGFIYWAGKSMNMW